MKIFFDEDCGASIPRALRELRLRNFSVEWPRTEANAPIKKGTADEIWIPWVAQRDYLIFSCNLAIWQAEAQRNLLLSEKAHAVFLTSGQERKLDVMRLILNQWSWLDSIWSSSTRPLVHRISITGAKSTLYPV